MKSLKLLVLLLLPILCYAQDPPYPSAPSPAPHIVAAEYFFDTDPGLGAGNSIPISPQVTDANLSSVNLDVSSLSKGIHVLFIRTQNINGVWSQTTNRLIAIENNYSGSPSSVSNIAAAEYFFDEDPGNGNGTPIVISPQGLDVTLSNTNLDVSSLSKGIHVLFIRTRNLDGEWSQTSHRLIAIENNYSGSPPSASNIVAAEYFFDEDPGNGNATPIVISSQGLDVSLSNTNLDVSSLSKGIHVLFIRTQNLDGEWSLISHRLIAIENNYPSSPAPSPNIVGAEYFVDTDPGFGSATSIPIVASSDVVLNNEGLDVSGLSVGLHNLFVRTLDANGRWSLTNAKLFENVLDVGYPNEPPPATNIVEIEYFFDEDPGFGNGISVAVSPQDVDVTLSNLNLDVSTLSRGIHVLFIRSRNDNGQWSQTSNQLIAIENNYVSSPPPKVDISSAEYFFNEDPGFGNGVSIPISPQGTNLSLDNTDLDVSNLPNGIHVLFVRTQNLNGSWSQTSNKLIAVENNYAGSPSASTQISNAEYFFNEDPGLGNGIPISIPSQGIDLTLGNTDLDVTMLPDGIHVLFIRSQNLDGDWSQTSHKLIAIESNYPSPPQASSDIVAAEYFIDTDPGFGAGSIVPITAGQNVILTNENLDASGFAVGDHILFIRTQNLDGEWSQTSNREFELVAPANAALNFDGVDDYLEVSDDPSLNLNDFSIETWVRTTQNAPFVRLITKSVGGQQNYSLIINEGKAQIRFDNGTSAQFVESTTNINDGNWHHLAGVRNAFLNTLDIFVDGVLNNSISTSGVPITGTDPLNVGRFSSSFPTPYFIGDLDEIRIWNFPLCEQEIQGRADSNLIGNEHGLVLYYDFNEGKANLDNTNITEVTDRSGNNNGTILNFDLGTTPPAMTSNFIESLDLLGDGLVTPQTNTWLGVDTDWNNTSNWSLGTIPGGCDDVVITDIPNQPSIDESTFAYVGSLTSVANSLLSISGIIRIRSHIVNDGLIRFNSQSATGSGQFDEFRGTISGVGAVEVQRDFVANRVFRFLASPVNTSTPIRDHWQEGQNNTAFSSPDNSANNSNTNPGFGTHITGSKTGANGFDATGSGDPSLFTFNNMYVDPNPDPINGANQNPGYSAIPNTNSANLEIGTPYVILIRGDRSINLGSNASFGSTTLRATGNLHYGRYPMNGSVPVSQQGNYWSLIANPYQAKIDFNTLTKTDLRQDVAVRDVNSDIWQTLTGPNRIIEPHQSFFVQNIGVVNAANLFFEENNKAVSGNNGSITVFDENQLAKAHLELYNQDGLVKDILKFRFSSDYNNDLDDNDFGKLFNENENLASEHPSMLLSIDRRNLPEDNEVIPLFINQYRSSNYEFRLKLENWDSNIDVYIVDNYLNSTTQITLGQSYFFTVDNVNPDSVAEDRFELSFDNTTLGLEGNPYENVFRLFPNPTRDGFFSFQTKQLKDKADVTITDMLGRQVLFKSYKISGDFIKINASSLNQGMYIVEIKSKDVAYTSKLIIK